MPHKRTTRAKTGAKVKLPDVEVAADLSESERQQQLQMFLSDFHLKTKTMLKDIEKSKKRLALHIAMTAEAQVARIPSELRHLTIREFAAAGGTYEAALDFVRQQKTRRIQALTCIQAPIPTIPEEPQDDADVKGAAAVGNMGTVRTTKRTVKSRYMKTPAITPKFNPQLPITPENIRDELPGERLMSMAGTPVRRALQDDRKMLEDNLATSGLNLTPKTMGLIIETVTCSVSAYRQ